MAVLVLHSRIGCQAPLPGKMFKMCVSAERDLCEMLGLGNKILNFILTTCLGRNFVSFTSSITVG